jgi:hypothetical protein
VEVVVVVVVVYKPAFVEVVQQFEREMDQFLVDDIEDENVVELVLSCFPLAITSSFTIVNSVGQGFYFIDRVDSIKKY